MLTFAKTFMSSTDFANVCEDARYEIYRHLDPVSRLLIDFDTDGRMLRILNPHLRFMIPRDLSYDEYSEYIMLYIIAGRFEQLLPDLENCVREKISDKKDNHLLISEKQLSLLKDIHQLSAEKRMKALYSSGYFETIFGTVVKNYTYYLYNGAYMINERHDFDQDINKFFVYLLCLRKFYADLFRILDPEFLKSRMCRVVMDFQRIYISGCCTLLSTNTNAPLYSYKAAQTLIGSYVSMMRSLPFSLKERCVVLPLLIEAKRVKLERKNILDMFCNALLSDPQYDEHSKLAIYKLMSPNALKRVITTPVLLRGLVNIAFERYQELLYYTGNPINEYVYLIACNKKLRPLLKFGDVKHLVRCVRQFERRHMHNGLTKSDVICCLKMGITPHIFKIMHYLDPSVESLIRKYVI